MQTTTERLKDGAVECAPTDNNYGYSGKYTAEVSLSVSYHLENKKNSEKAFTPCGWNKELLSSKQEGSTPDQQHSCLMFCTPVSIVSL